VLVLLGPDFDGSDQGYQTLARATGLLPYDLRTRVKPGSWGLVKAFGDAAQASELASRLSSSGFSVVCIDRQVATDPERRQVPVHALELGETSFKLKLKERDMSVPYGALSCIVEGEVQPGRAAGTSAPGVASSGAIRAVTPGSGEMQVFREANLVAPIGYLAADLHFATVRWIARIDSRVFDFGPARSGNVAVDVANLSNQLAAKAGVRVDRSVRSSSVASFAEQPSAMRAGTPVPTGLRGKSDALDARFDSYSRVVGEAERLGRAPIRAGG
jgi:hypothetical protein